MLARCQSGTEKSVLSRDSHEDILSPIRRAEPSGMCSIILFAFVTLSMKEMQMLSDANYPGLETLSHGAGRIVA